MNRIREIRERLGVSAEELAEQVGTTATTIRRLETGKRQLTELWMRQIAAALNVHPADLLDTAALAELCDDVRAETPPEMASVAGALKAKNMGFYRVLTDAVADAGRAKGALILADHDSDSVAHARSGDIVIAEAAHGGTTSLILRVLVQPDMLVTNRRASNVVIKMHGDGVDVTIVGVVIPDDGPHPRGTDH